MLHCAIIPTRKHEVPGENLSECGGETPGQVSFLVLFCLVSSNPPVLRTSLVLVLVFLVLVLLLLVLVVLALVLFAVIRNVS